MEGKVWGQGAREPENDKEDKNQGTRPRDLGERETRHSLRLRDKCAVVLAMIRVGGLARWASRARSRPQTLMPT